MRRSQNSLETNKHVSECSLFYKLEESSYWNRYLGNKQTKNSFFYRELNVNRVAQSRIVEFQLNFLQSNLILIEQYNRLAIWFFLITQESKETYFLSLTSLANLVIIRGFFFFPLLSFFCSCWKIWSHENADKFRICVCMCLGSMKLHKFIQINQFVG